MIHEFGHYNAAYHAAERCLYEPATLDVAEIHSQGLEVLFFDYMDDMFGENGKVLEMSSLWKGIRDSMVCSLPLRTGNRRTIPNSSGGA